MATINEMQATNIGAIAVLQRWRKSSLPTLTNSETFNTTCAT
jgi:hypothetical protein